MPLVSAFGYLDSIKPTNFNQAKAPYFHYNIWAHHYSEHIGSSGRAESPGNDFLVTLGSFTNEIGTRFHQAGTFVHELGHNLNLGHGGSEGINCKSNYLSVMNYLFQVTGLTSVNGGTTTTTIDYSRDALPNLQEAQLVENSGISNGPIRTFWNDTNGITRSGLGNGALDWNGNGLIDPNLVSVNLNNFKICGYSGLETLNGFNDWNHLLLKFTNTGNYADGVHNNLPPELTFEEFKQLEEELNEASSANIIASKKVEGYKVQGDELKYIISIENTGGADATDLIIKDILPKNVSYSESNDTKQPKPSEIIRNSDGTTTLIWNIQKLNGKQKYTIEYSVIISSLIGNGKITNNLSITYGDIFNNKYPPVNASVTAFISIAKCNPGDNATGGGFELSGNAKILSSKPLKEGDGWQAIAIIGDQSIGSVKAFARCVDN